MHLVAAAAFTPAAGVLHELPLSQGDHVELLDQPAPEGWCVVRHSRTHEAGLVPESFLLVAEEDDEDTAEDDKGTGGEATPAAAASAASAASAAAAGKNAGGGGASADAAEESVARSERLRALYKERESKRVATREFKPDPGSAFELPMLEGDVLELADVKWPVPPGWLAVKRPGNGASGAELVGLVPENCVEMLPEPEEALPSAEEQKEAAERALKLANEERERTELELQAREAELKEEIARKEAAEKAERERLEQLKAAEASKEE